MTRSMQQYIKKLVSLRGRHTEGLADDVKPIDKHGHSKILNPSSAGEQSKSFAWRELLT